MARDLPGRPEDVQLLGYAALIDHYDLPCPVPRRLTAIGAIGRKTTAKRDGVDWVLLPRSASYRIAASPIENLTIALKHEGVDMRVMDRLFTCGIESDLQALIANNPRGIYTRRAWFFYEWMTGRRLDLPDVEGSPYIPALDPNTYIVTASSPRSARHKVLDNLPGGPGFCPLLRRTERLQEDRTGALAEEARTAVSSADPAVLRRAVSYLLLNESRGSFGIEGERPARTRLERWGRTIADARDVVLSIPALESLQRSLFDPKDHHFVKLGLRTQGGFVGRHDRDNNPVPDLVSAKPDDLESLMTALLSSSAYLELVGFDPILTAAVVGFGFVFIHPFEDGNGRLHRFLIQKALADMGFNPPGVVLPVSAAILEDLPGYRAALEDYSAPALDAVEWEPTADGNVHVTNETAYLYRYFDATRQAEYLVDRIERTIRFALPAELDYLHRFDDAKRRLADVVDLPDRLASLFIQFCVQNAGRLSRRKADEFFPGLDPTEQERMEAAVGASGIVASPGGGSEPQVLAPKA